MNQKNQESSYATKDYIIMEKRIREKIKTDLLKIADDEEFEDLRREVIRYFETL